MASNPAEKENLDLADLALAREDGAKRLKARGLLAAHPRPAAAVTAALRGWSLPACAVQP